MTDVLPSYFETVALPIEDELPSYSPSLHTYDIVMYKQEMKSPSVLTSAWIWHLCIVELNSTQINFYKFNDIDKVPKMLKKIFDFKTKPINQANGSICKLLSDPRFETNKLLKWCFDNEDSVESIPFELINPYIGPKLVNFTLQYAQIGVAKDQRDKSKYIFRLRLELEQYLFLFMNKQRFIRFDTDFKIARCVSMAVEDRVISDKELIRLDTLNRFKSWQGMVCLPWDEDCEAKFAGERKFEKLFFYFDEAIDFKRKQMKKRTRCKEDVFRFKRFIIRDCGIEEYQ